MATHHGTGWKPTEPPGNSGHKAITGRVEDGRIRALMVIGSSVRLVDERFLPAEPTGVIADVDFDAMTITFDEDFGGGRGTYPASHFVPFQPGELELADRAVRAVELRRQENRPRCVVCGQRLLIGMTRAAPDRLTPSGRIVNGPRFTWWVHDHRADHEAVIDPLTDPENRPDSPAELASMLREYHAAGESADVMLDAADILDHLASVALDRIDEDVEYLSRRLGDRCQPSDLRVSIDGTVRYLYRADGKPARDLGPCASCGHEHDGDRCMAPVHNPDARGNPEAEGAVIPCGCPAWNAPDPRPAGDTDEPF